MESTGFDEIADLALRKSGHVFRPAQRYVIEARLGDIIRREGFANLDGLAHCLKVRPNRELEKDVIAALPAKKTGFFGGRALLERVINQVVPGISPNTPSSRLRILCAGGGAGQEAYSLAILQAERDAQREGEKPVDIVSVDICRDTSHRGLTGRFSHFEIQTGLSVHHMLDYFERCDDGSWQAGPELRERIGFRTHNLMEDLSGLGEFDVILCRHVISSMPPGVGRGVMERLAQQLTPEGVLFLGEGELIQMDDHYSLRLSKSFRDGYKPQAMSSTNDSIAS